MLEQDPVKRDDFKNLNRGITLLWRLGLGKMLNKFPGTLGKQMVLVHTGRVSGKRYQTPLNYTEIGGDLFCVAGFGHGTDWYQNILEKPEIEVWLPNGWWAGVAEPVINRSVRAPLLRALLVDSGTAAPLMGISPMQLDDFQINELTQDDVLIRLRRTAPLTGDGGPGDLVGFWQIATAVLLGLMLTQPYRSWKSDRRKARKEETKAQAGAEIQEAKELKLRAKQEAKELAAKAKAEARANREKAR